MRKRIKQLARGKFEYAKPQLQISEEEIDAYYADSVFLGDSIMLGFRNYTRKQPEESFLKRIQFLAAGSYSASNSLWDITAESVHLSKEGFQRINIHSESPSIVAHILEDHLITESLVVLPVHFVHMILFTVRNVVGCPKQGTIILVKRQQNIAQI